VQANNCQLYVWGRSLCSSDSGIILLTDFFPLLKLVVQLQVSGNRLTSSMDTALLRAPTARNLVYEECSSLHSRSYHCHASRYVRCNSKDFRPCQTPVSSSTLRVCSASYKMDLLVSVLMLSWRHHTTSEMYICGRGNFNTYDLIVVLFLRRDRINEWPHCLM
jgi:hypothetical protein